MKAVTKTNHRKPQINHEASRTQYLVRFGPDKSSLCIKYQPKGTLTQEQAHQKAKEELKLWMEKALDPVVLSGRHEFVC